MLEHAGHGTATGAPTACGTATAKGPRSMLIPVGVLTVLAAVGGFLDIPGVWEPVRATGSTRSPSRSSMPSVAQDYGTSFDRRDPRP